MQASIGKPVHKTDGQKGNQDLVGVETGKAGSTKVNHGPASSVIMGNAKNMSNPITCTISSTLDSSTSASTNLKLKCSGNMKKPSNGSFSFFDRYFFHGQWCLYFIIYIFFYKLQLMKKLSENTYFNVCL